jgi:hypothetical protein
MSSSFSGLASIRPHARFGMTFPCQNYGVVTTTIMTKRLRYFLRNRSILSRALQLLPLAGRLRSPIRMAEAATGFVVKFQEYL